MSRSVAGSINFWTQTTRRAASNPIYPPNSCAPSSRDLLLSPHIGARSLKSSTTHTLYKGHSSPATFFHPTPTNAAIMGLSREARIITLLVIDSAFFFLEIIVGECALLQSLAYILAS